MLEIKLGKDITEKTTRTLVERDFTKVYSNGVSLTLTLCEDYEHPMRENGRQYYEIDISVCLQQGSESDWKESNYFYLPRADYSSYNNDIDKIKDKALDMLDYLFSRESMTVETLINAGFYFD